MKEKRKNSMLSFRRFVERETLIPAYFLCFYLATALNWRIGLLVIAAYYVFSIWRYGVTSRNPMRIVSSVLWTGISFLLIVVAPLIALLWFGLIIYISGRDATNVWRMRKNYRKYRAERRKEVWRSQREKGE